MNTSSLVKKAISGPLSENEQVALVRSMNQTLSSLTLLLQRAHGKYESTKKVDEISKRLQRSK